MNPIERLRKPPLDEKDTDQFVWKKWFDSVFLQVFNEVNPNDVVTSDTTLSLGFLIPVDASGGAITIRLPASNLAKAKKYFIKKIDSSANAVTVDADGSDLIDGEATQTLAEQWDSLFIESDGLGNWYLLMGGGGGGGGTFTPDTIQVTAAEAIAAGQFVAVFDDAGTFKCRVANSSLGQGYQADGFCKDPFAEDAVATIWLPGTVNDAAGTGLTPGDVWLGDDGYATSTPPDTAGWISQQIGVTEDGNSVAFEPMPDILIATPQSVAVGSTLQSQTFLSNGTFTPPFGVTAVWVDIYAGGGAGGGGTTASPGGGGGSGEYCEGFLVPVSGATSVVIGAGGTGNAGAAGNSGGNSSFGTWVCLGGQGGGVDTTVWGGDGGGVRGAVAGSGNGSPGTDESPAFYGGSSGGGSTATGGGSGGRMSGGSAGNTGAGLLGGGGGGATPLGAGANGGDGNSAGPPTAATANTGTGGGGGGRVASGTSTGGNGSSGKVVVYWVGPPIL